MNAASLSVLTTADLSWIRLRRHDEECSSCWQLRRKEAETVANLARLIMIYPGKPADELQCDERKRLAKEHFMNMQQEKGEPSKTEAELGPLTFDHMREKNVTRCTRDFEHDLGSWSAMEWAAAAAGELGELCNALKKQRRRADKIKKIGANKPIPTKQDVADEIADTVLYLDLLAAREGIDLGEAIRRKFNEKSDETGSKIRL